MQKIKSILLTLPAICLVMLGLFSAAAYAEGSSSGSSGDSTNSTSGNTTGTDGTSNPTPPPASCPTNKKEERPCFIKPDQKEVEDSKKQSEQEGQLVIDNLKKEHKEHTALDRQKFCEGNKIDIENRLKNIQKAAGAYLTRIDTAFTKAVAYQKNKNIQVTDWDTLVANATSAQTQAASSVAALQALDPNIDCTSPTAAQQLATFQAASKQARADLKAYKAAVIKIYIALGIITSEGNQ